MPQIPAIPLPELSWAWFYLGIAFVLLTFAIFTVRLIYFHPLSKFHGPVLASLTDLWRASRMFNGEIEHDIRKLHLKYGPVVRIGPNSVSVSHPAVIRQIWGEGPRVPKSRYYDGFTAIRPNLFGMRDEVLHAHTKRTLAHAFSRKNILAMEEVIDDGIRKLREILDRHAVSGEPMDLRRWIKLLVFDVLGVLLFNRSFGALESGDMAKLPLTEAHVRIALAAGLVPWTVGYLEWLPKVQIKSVQKLYDGRRLVVKMAKECIQDLPKGTAGEGTLLKSLLCAQDPDTSQSLDIEDVEKMQGHGLRNAGSTTTSATLMVLFWHLLSHPEKLKILVNELDTGIPDTSNRQAIPSGQECFSLAYLTACHKEASRIYPIFGSAIPRIVPDDGRSLGDSTIPGGVEACVWPYIIHNDESIWGSDAAQFIPERWLGNSNAKAQRTWMPFGVGHRACIGKNLAETEILKIVATVFRNYELDMLEPLRGVPYKECVRNVVGVELKGPLLVHARKRTA